MKLLNVNALSILAAEQVYVLVKNQDRLALVTFSEDFSEMKELFSFTGNRGYILFANNNDLLLSIDNNLVLLRDNKCKTVLKAYRDGNVFWHACKFHETVLVQEYGIAPTSIYGSGDLLNWKEVVSNLDIDRYSHHFHYLVHDPYRDRLIATLGDGNYVRAICSDDEGLRWGPLFCGAWQFIPVVPLRDQIVCGLDSGLVCGGIGIYDLVKHRWKFTFLKWLKNEFKIAQISELKKLDNNLWVIALGAPQGIMVSKDFGGLYKVYMEGFNPNFNPHIGIAESETHLVCCTGRNLLIFEKEDLAKIISEDQPLLVKQYALGNKLGGKGSILKRQFKSKFLKKPVY